MNILVYRRHKLGLSQTDVGNKTGINHATICAWETGRVSSLNNATKDHIYNYLKLMGIGSVSALEQIIANLYNSRHSNLKKFEADVCESKRLGMIEYRKTRENILKDSPSDINELVYRRCKLGLNRSELAELVSIPSCTIEKWENGYTSRASRTSNNAIKDYLDVLEFKNVEEFNLILEDLSERRLLDKTKFDADVRESKRIGRSEYEKENTKEDTKDSEPEVVIADDEHEDNCESMIVKSGMSGTPIIPKTDADSLAIAEILEAIYDSKCLTFTQFKALENYLK